MSDLKKLKLVAKGFSVLYVEDNKALRTNAAKLLQKFFDKVDVASDGKEGLEKFKRYHYPLVITDIKMPNMNGLTFINHVKKINPEAKIIIMSAYDDKNLLFKAIELGIFRFLKKPVNVTELTNVLYLAILEIEQEYNSKIFYANLKNVFNYQSSMVAMLDKNDILLTNDKFLEFFNYESIEKCKDSMKDIGSYFLKHEGFLYNHDGIQALDIIKKDPEKIYHIKLKDQNNNICHFILKYQSIPDKDEYGVLSFDDITELNLLKLFDEKQNIIDKVETNTKAIFDLLSVIQRNSASIKIHNYYKGLSITNDAIIVNTDNNTLTIKTIYTQQKSIQMEQRTLIDSSALPYVIECSEIKYISYKTQEIEFSSLKFVKTSAITRSTIRVVPGEKQTVSLFFEENKFHGDVEIEDISIEAIKLKLNALPAGLENDSEVIIDIVLELDKKPLIINTKAKLFKKSESKHNFHLVFIFDDFKKSDLIKYITKRQMELIRELKGMQNG